MINYDTIKYDIDKNGQSMCVTCSDDNMQLSFNVRIPLALTIVGMFYNDRDSDRLLRQLSRRDDYRYSDYHTFVDCTIVTNDRRYNAQTSTFVINLHDYAYFIFGGYYDNSNKRISFKIPLTCSQLIEFVQHCGKLLTRRTEYMEDYINKKTSSMVVRS